MRRDPAARSRSRPPLAPSRPGAPGRPRRRVRPPGHRLLRRRRARRARADHLDDWVDGRSQASGTSPSSQCRPARLHRERLRCRSSARLSDARAGATPLGRGLPASTAASTPPARAASWASRSSPGVRRREPPRLRLLLDHDRQPGGTLRPRTLGRRTPAISNWTLIVTGLPHNPASTTAAGCGSNRGPARSSCSTGDAGDRDRAAVTTLPRRQDPAGRPPTAPPWPGNASGHALVHEAVTATRRASRSARGANDPYSVEHGPDVNDEVNKLVNGGNGGWNPNDGAGGYDQSKPMTDPGATELHDPVWQSGGVTVAPSGGTFLVGAQWKTWNGALGVACLDGSPSVGQRLLVMSLNGRRHRAHAARGHRRSRPRAAPGPRCRDRTATSTSSPTATAAPARSGRSSRSDPTREALAAPVAYPDAVSRPRCPRSTCCSIRRLAPIVDMVTRRTGPDTLRGGERRRTGRVPAGRPGAADGYERTGGDGARPDRRPVARPARRPHRRAGRPASRRVTPTRTRSPTTTSRSSSTIRPRPTSACCTPARTTGRTRAATAASTARSASCRPGRRS